MSFIKGQRWISDSEPELGLGSIVSFDGARVQILFAASGEMRTYAVDNAPLKRVRFRAGDKIKTAEGAEFVVREVRERHGLLVYIGADEQQVPEARLSDLLSLQGPEDRLYAGRFDDPSEFELRKRTLTLLHQFRKSPVRGFVGGRIDLIPHQLYIAQEVANRHAPRVMLSDEVGLGKTIEACLILHRLLLSGRAERILVLVPETLVHQWFLEMLRRFNVWLHIFDEERCASIEAGDPDANPFLDDQLILTSIDFLARDERRAAQAAEAGWDILVVDEAHHLEWSAEGASREYQVVEALTRRSEGLLLLTATPEQLGMESHFARLRLLDPDRFTNLATFEEAAKEYRRTAELADKLLTGKPLVGKDTAVLERLMAHDTQLGARLEHAVRGDAEARAGLLTDLLDLHGPGRVLFRNTRASMAGFPKRVARLAPLETGPDAERVLDRLAMEFAVDAGDKALEFTFDLATDARIVWLAELLQKLTPEKVLLICRSVEKAEAIDEALRRRLNIKMAVFHEGLTLVQRDRHAAWFAETDGARLLVCSEIGSEGRNFQFAHHLVLFDLPLNPELLEQRIGRLDRIGQKHQIEIHVPFFQRSPQEVLTRWYHEALNAFEKNLEGGNAMLTRFGRMVHDLALEFPVAERAAAEQELATLLHDTRKARRDMQRLLEEGRDRLLEMNSFRPAIAAEVVDQIRQADARTELEEYMLDVFEHYGVHVEELGPHTWQLNPRGVTTESFPSMPEEGMIATTERQRAVGREDVAFLTADHPMVSGAMDLLLGSETGNCSFAMLPVEKERTLLLEAVYVLEAVAMSRLHVDRFLPATPIRLVVNHTPQEVSASYSGPGFEQKLRRGSPFKLIENPEIARRMLPAMLRHAHGLAEARAEAIRSAALVDAVQLLGHEVNRLKVLSGVNDHIRPDEILSAQRHHDAVVTAIREARLRLDCLRLIWKGPAEILA